VRHRRTPIRLNDKHAVLLLARLTDVSHSILTINHIQQRGSTDRLQVRVLDVILTTTNGLVLPKSCMVVMLNAQVTLRFKDLITICKIPFVVSRLSTTFQVASIAIAATIRVQYLLVDVFENHWLTTEIAILHAYPPVDAGLIT
jgi:hypothetical protein